VTRCRRAACGWSCSGPAPGTCASSSAGGRSPRP